MTITKQQFDNTAKYMRVKPTVIDMRIHIDGNVALRKALDESPELETELILRAAVHNSDLLLAIKETASNRWADGYSDSLYMAVLCNIKETGEPRTTDAYCKTIQQPITDWDKELQKYKH